MTINLKSEIARVDYNNTEQSQQLLELLDDYARDPMGGNEPLSRYTRENLINALSATPGAFSLIAYVDDQPAGFANCLQSFSTFHCKPLINIHDIAVSERYRGKGIARNLLAGVDEVARQRGCCKVTLEVLEGNHAAKAAYLRHGFEGYKLAPELGKAEFWQKKL